MFNFKIIFLIILLLNFVYFLAGNDPDDEDDNENYVVRSYDKSQFNGYTNCILEMMPMFGRVQPSGQRIRLDSKHPAPLSCVKKAVTKLSIYGGFPSVLEPNVEYYYKTFYLYVKLESVPTPYNYCVDFKRLYGNNLIACREALKMFEQDMEFDHKLPILTEGDASILQNILSQLSNYDVGGQLPNYDVGGTIGESSAQVNQFIEYKMRILKNALYYHKIIPSLHGFEDQEDEVKINNHLQRTHGYDYLMHIKKLIKLKEGDLMMNPWQYCQKYYPKQDLDCDPRQFLYDLGMGSTQRK